MKKLVLTVITLEILSLLCFFEADAIDTIPFNEFFIYSVPGGYKNAIREIIIPPANTNNSIQYLLFTRNHPRQACYIEPTPEDFDRCDFNPDLETKILIHGFFVSLDTDNSLLLVKDALLEYDSYNVIYVDWSRYNSHPVLLAIFNTIPVAKRVAEFVKFMKKHTGTEYSSYHIIGHSLGAHISGMVGKNIDTLGRITGLDPAGPPFVPQTQNYQLLYTDADFVDVIHSSYTLTVTGLGEFHPVGDLDFYPDGGISHAACEMSVKANASRNVIKKLEAPYYLILCNHFISITYFLNSIFECEYLSTECDSYDNLPECESRGNPTARMGFFAKPIDGLPVKSKFYLKTNATSPYC